MERGHREMPQPDFEISSGECEIIIAEENARLQNEIHEINEGKPGGLATRPVYEASQKKEMDAWHGKLIDQAKAEMDQRIEQRVKDVIALKKQQNIGDNTASRKAARRALLEKNDAK